MGQAMRKLFSFGFGGQDPVKTAMPQLAELRHLKPGWNGDRATRPDEDAIVQAERMVGWLAYGLAGPAISPTVGGGVCLRWVVNGREVEIVFRRKGGEYLIADVGNPEPIEDGEFHQVEELKALVGKHGIPVR